MSTETLRKAAALMRVRAERAEVAYRARGSTDRGLNALIDVQAAIAGHPSFGDHIANMSPAVAVAVADWLDSTAAEADVRAFFAFGDTAPECAALAVARAYLGETP